MKFVNPSCEDNKNCDGTGTKLKASDDWNSYSGVPKGTDDYGFSALPGGLGNSGGSFDGVGNYGSWWSSSESNANCAYFRYMRYNYESVGWGNDDKDYLRSVRCLQD